MKQALGDYKEQSPNAIEIRKLKKKPNGFFIHFTQFIQIKHFKDRKISPLKRGLRPYGL
jgi:hypothetical protein